MADKIQESEKHINEGGVFANPESYSKITTPHDPADGTFFNTKAGNNDGVLDKPTSHSKKACQYEKPPHQNQIGNDHTYGTTVGKISKRKKF
jgi:hypothetical protein